MRIRPLAFVALAVGALAWRSAPATAADAVFRFAVIVPAGGDHAGLAAETAYGVSLAVKASNAARARGAKRVQVETVDVTAADAAAAVAALDDAAKKKLPGAVALVTEPMAAEVEAAARKHKLPVVLLGPATAARTIDPADPVFRVEPAAADRGATLAELLRLRSAKSAIGLPAETKRAWLLIEDTAWARAVAAALRADAVTPLADADVVVQPGAPVDAAAIAKAKSAGCDRAVVIGGSAALRAVRTSLEQARWDVPLLATDAALDSVQPQGKPERRRGLVIAAQAPSWTVERKFEEWTTKHPPADGRPPQVTPAGARAFVAATALIEAALGPSKKPLAAALRELAEGSGGRQASVFDACGSVDRWIGATWAAGADGNVAPVKAAFLPDATIGLLVGPGLGARFRCIPGMTCVRVGFGGGEGAPPRTIDADLATLGLFAGASGGRADELVRAELLARTCSKLSRIWGRHYDGAARPASSFRISFVPEGADATPASVVWEATVAGDGPDGLHGGQAFPATKRCTALSTYLLRLAPLLHQAKLDPPLAASDVVCLEGRYGWNESAEGNSRADKLRALLDGVASTFSMKLSKEIGHLAGLSIDGSRDPRSVMVTVGGEGVGDEFAYFPPAFAKVLEKTLGRVGADGK